MRRALLAMVLVGCGPGDDLPLEGVRVVGARLEKWNLGGFAVMGGGLSGSAELQVDAVGGQTFEVPVSLGGGVAGLLIDMGADMGGTVELDLPSTRVTGDQLFGTYRGSREGIVLLVGAYGHHLENEAGVRIDETTVGLGMSILVAAEWLVISPDLPEDETGDTGATTSTSSTSSGDTATTGSSTGDTGDTG